MDDHTQKVLSVPASASKFSDTDVRAASVYHDPLARGRQRTLIMRQWPRGVPAKRPDGAMTFDMWVPDAAPSKPLLHSLQLRLKAWAPAEHDAARAQFMIDYIQEVSERLISRIVFYDPTDIGWVRVPRDVEPSEDGKRETVLDWLLQQAQWMRLTLLCHEKAPADPVEEARGLYCHRAALLKLLHAPDVDSVLRHYKSIEEEERAKINAR